MTDTLKIIQKIVKIARAVSNVVFYCCVIGGVFCVAGVIALGFGIGSLTFGSVTLYGFIQQNVGETLDSMYLALAVGLFVCTGEAVVARFAERCLRHELAAGTPFTIPFARELMRLGILTAAIPLACSFAASIASGALSLMRDGNFDISVDPAGAIGTGVMLVVMALVCRLGAEQTGKAAEE